MKKLYSLLLSFSLILVLFTGFSVTAFGADDYTYTLMVYMVGSDLESDGYAATSDLLEMIAAQYDEDVAVVIQTGGAKDWHTDKFGLSPVNSNKLERWLVTEDNIILLGSKAPENMGKSTTLEDFIVYGMTHYPAQNYGLIMWNHGSGPIFGFGSDEQYGYDNLTILEMEIAFRNAYELTGNRMDFVGFDACLMGSIEVAEMLVPYADYLVASEELEPGHGWDYQPIIESIQRGNTGANLGIDIANGFLAHSQENLTDKTITLSVIQLDQIDLLISELNQLLQRLTTDLSDEALSRAIIRARLKSESYGEGNSAADDSDLVDLADFLNRLPDSYQIDGRKVINKLENAVVYNLNSALKPKASGLSIYIPTKNEAVMNYALNLYKNLSFSTDYYEFLQAYVEVLLAGGETLDYSADLETVTEETYSNISDVLSMDDLDGDHFNYYMYLKAEHLELVDQVYQVIGTVDETGDIIYLGKDLVIRDNILSDGTVIGTTLDYWVSLEGYFVPMYFLGFDESGYLYYYIPIRINTKDYDLIVLFSEVYPEGTVLGARPYNQSQNGLTLFSRDLVQLKKDDWIGLIYEIDILENGYYEYDNWSVLERFKFDGDLDFHWEVLPDGSYAYSFELWDIYQNTYYSDWILYDYSEMDLIDYSYEHNTLWDMIDGFDTENETTGTNGLYDTYEWLSNPKDVPSTWALDYIDWAYYYGLTTDSVLEGFTDEITRGEFSELVVKIYETAMAIDVAITDFSVFVDTQDLAALKAYELGIVTGYTDGSFRADSKISRQELMTMFYRLVNALDNTIIGYEPVNLYTLFTDANSIGGFAWTPSEFMVSHQLVAGVGNGKIDPLATSTKEVAIKIALGVYEYYLGIGYKNETDQMMINEL